MALIKRQNSAISVASFLLFPFTCWNWKAAILSAVIRSFIYLLTTMKHSSRSELHTIAAEMFYVVLTAGIYSAVQQRVLDVQPRWLSNLIVVAAIPVLSQSVEYIMHVAAGTPNLRTATISVLSFGLLSALFHLHVMRKGAMLVGSESRPFSDDLKRMPSLVVSFIAVPVLAIMEVARRSWENDEAAA
jgi:hypothetical protein